MSSKVLVGFEPINDEQQLFNLALCTVFPDGTEDCSSASRNGDITTVLETVAQIALIYSSKFPDRKIFFQGSDAARSRKYQMGFNQYLEDLGKNYRIEGVMIDKNGDITHIEAFQTGKNYSGFIFTRKKD